jgi:hypothetical protein
MKSEDLLDGDWHTFDELDDGEPVAEPVEGVLKDLTEHPALTQVQRESVLALCLSGCWTWSYVENHADGSVWCVLDGLESCKGQAMWVGPSGERRVESPGLRDS